MSSIEDEAALVAALAPFQLEKLRKNCRKPHWSHAPMGYLTKRIHDEARELSRAVRSGASPDEVAREAADVANFAAMVAVEYRRRREDQ